MKTVDEVRSGKMPDRYASANVKEACTYRAMLETERARDYLANKVKARAALRDPERPELSGKRAYVDDDAQAPTNTNIQAMLRGCGLVRTFQREAAEVFIVRDLQHVGQRNT
eukprot:13386264-Alexandrium_andersonii.AAC.1